MIYLIGSLRNPKVPLLANYLRKQGFEVFDEWVSPGEAADEKWQEYERARGRTYKQALNGAHARNVFEFDKKYLEAAAAVVLVQPAGKSAHLELGYVMGRGGLGYILLDGEPERYDIMPLFATEVCETMDELVERLERSCPK